MLKTFGVTALQEWRPVPTFFKSYSFLTKHVLASIDKNVTKRPLNIYTHAQAQRQLFRCIHTMPSLYTQAKTSKQSPKINDEIVLLQSKLKYEILKPPYLEKPSKQQLLAEANGFFHRFKIRSKWFLIRDNRPFKFNELGTLFSWFFLSQVIWFILGTTTFVSLLLFSVDAVLGDNQDFVSMVLNKGWGSKNISFDIKGDVLPRWRKGCISMKNLRIKTLNDEVETQKDSGSLLGVSGKTKLSFDVDINTVELTLSLQKWLKGYGLIDAVKIIGINGDITLLEDPMSNDWIKNKQYMVNKIVVQDAKIMYNNKYELTIFNMKVPKFRFNNSIYDILNASVVSGAINDSLFTIHKRQHNLAYINDASKDINSTWERITRVHLDQIPVKQLGLTESKSFSWIDDGEVEFTADIMVPKETLEQQEEDQQQTVLTANYNNDYTPQTVRLESDDENSSHNSSNKYMVIDLKLTFKDLKAKMPEDAPQLSTKEVICELDEIRPLVEYVNSKRNWFHSVQARYNQSFIKSEGMEDTNDSPSSQDSSIFPRFPLFFNEPDSHTATFPQITVKTWPEDEDGDVTGKEIIKYHNVDPHNNNEIILSCRIVINTQDIKGKTLLKETKIYDTVTMELYYDIMRIVEQWEYKNSHNWKKLWTATFMSQLLLLGLGSVA